MEYIVTEEQIDRILEPFFEEHFGDAKLIEYNNIYDGGDDENYKEAWKGFSITKDGERKILLGRPLSGPDNNDWFSNGEYFNGWWNVFNLEVVDFNESMRRFVNEKYDMNIDKIW